MSSVKNIPADWTVETEQTTYDDIMGRDYTTVLYRQEETRSAVYITEVIDGANVWEYRVHHSRDGNLGTATDLEEAKELAVTFMNDSAASA